MAFMAIALAVGLAATGCTRATVLESDAANRTTTTTIAIRPVPNGGAQLPEVPDPTDAPAPTSSSSTPTTAAPSVESATTVRPATPRRPKAKPATTTTRPNVPPAKAAATVTPTPVTTTTVPPPSSTTTTTLLPNNPSNLVLTVNPSFAVQGSTQLFQYALSDPTSGPIPTTATCGGTDYTLSTTGYVLAPFQSTDTCNAPGQLLRTIPADAPLGVYEFCTTVVVDPSPTTACTPYYIINFATSFQ
jgi:hypothetical protein